MKSLCKKKGINWLKSTHILKKKNRSLSQQKEIQQTEYISSMFHRLFDIKGARVEVCVATAYKNIEQTTSSESIILPKVLEIFLTYVLSYSISI